MLEASVTLDDIPPVCCVALSSTPNFPLDDAARLAGRLKALADPARLRLIAYMLSRPNHEACTCDLAPAVGLSEPTVSHHLKTLEKAGLVSKERRGMNVHYSVESAAIRALGVAIQLESPAHPTEQRQTKKRETETMPRIRIYEPALCCDTGVCGIDVDQSLVTITADVRAVNEMGADITRHNLASDPTAFTDDETVSAFMHTVGSKGLPLTIVDGVTVAVGSYPTKQTLFDLAGLVASPVSSSALPSTLESGIETGIKSGQLLDLGLTDKAAGSCCGDTGCC